MAGRFFVAMTQHVNAQSQQQQRERIGNHAEQIAQQISHISAEHAAKVACMLGLADVRPAGIQRVVAEQAHQQIQRQW